uniref:hypothetical protein n=1 Tax=Mesorhizobium sp. L-2-11 TaxID=2744521 RepID=UPI001FD549B0|nr:hypothetical protein [Mesorhizobium sp. L-2-11]
MSPDQPGMSCGAFRLSERHTAQMISAATRVVPVRSRRIVHAPPSASRISGMSMVSVSPPMAVMRRPFFMIVVGRHGSSRNEFGGRRKTGPASGVSAKQPKTRSILFEAVLRMIGEAADQRETASWS